MSSWFAELKRRRVFRTLVAYAIVAFAVLQIIEPIMHGAHWPDIVLSYVVAGLAAGFPIVVAIAWVFDIRGGRIERTAPAPPAAGPRGIRLALSLVGIGALAAAPGLAWYFLFRSNTRIVARKDGEPARPPERKSIAVLPFVNIGGDKENEYFSDGMTEEVINALANVDGLRVASRTAAFAFRGKNPSIRTIGEQLNVGAVLEGSVRREGDRLRISAQLINVADGYHLWSNMYERELKGIFALEEELARSIAQALKAKLVSAEGTPLVKPATTNLVAHDLYLKGRYFSDKPETMRKAIEYFQQAIEEDPSYALAYVGLADSNARLSEYSSSAAETLPKAKQAAYRALELDGKLAEAHEVLGLISLDEYDWSTAERELRRTIELKPEYPWAHHVYSVVLRTQGRLEEARAESEHARQLDPTSLAINHTLAFNFVATREYDRAIEQMKKTLELDPSFQLPRVVLALVYAVQGRHGEAVAELKKLGPASELPASYAGSVGGIYAMAGRRAEALRILAELEERSKLEYVPASARALIYIGLGDKDRAFAWLDKAYAERDWRLRELNVNPRFDSLRSDPRFTRLLKQMHLQ